MAKSAVLMLVLLVLHVLPQLHAAEWGTTTLGTVPDQVTNTRRLISVNSSSNTSVDCSTYKLTAAAANAHTPRVIDCFLMNSELDMAEIRLRELEQVVDVFVIVESRMTFRGTHRSLHYPRLIHRLPASLIAKIKYIVLDTLEGKDAWAKETYQRNALFDVGLKTAQPAAGDIIMVADCDEIPKPSFLLALKHCEGAQYPLSMQSTIRYYAYDMVLTSAGKYWQQPRATTYSIPFDVNAQDLRRGAAKALYPDTSWHCSWCFNTISAVQNKLSSFSHAEHDTPANHDPQSIIAKVQAGKALLHPGTEFARDPNADMPEFIKSHPSRFMYLVTRNTSDAGFRDLDQLS